MFDLKRHGLEEFNYLMYFIACAQGTRSFGTGSKVRLCILSIGFLPADL